MAARVWNVFQRGGGHPAKLAWALKEHLEDRGFRVERVARTEWGYLIEVAGLSLSLADHPTEPGLLELRLEPKGRLRRLWLRPRLEQVAAAINAFLEEEADLTLEGVGV